jgi:hypothetical protein
MSLIFNEFVNVDRAREFVATVRERFGLEGQVFESEDDAHVHDPFPWVQEPPVTHIDRTDLATEEQVIALACEFGGTFLGT